MQPGHTNPSLRGFILVDLLWRNTRSLCQLLNANSKLAPRQTKAHPDKCINSGWLPGDMWVLLQRITSHTTFRQVSNVLWNSSQVSAARRCRRFERSRLQADSGGHRSCRELCDRCLAMGSHLLLCCPLGPLSISVSIGRSFGDVQARWTSTRVLVEGHISQVQVSCRPCQTETDV